MTCFHDIVSKLIPEYKIIVDFAAAGDYLRWELWQSDLLRYPIFMTGSSEPPT